MAPCRSSSLAPETCGVIRTLGSDHNRAGVGQADRLAEGFDLVPIRGAEALNIQDVDCLHELLARTQFPETEAA